MTAKPDSTDSTDTTTPPSGALAQLRFSIGNLLSEFGSTDDFRVGLAINGSLALIGIIGWYLTTGVVAYIAAVWAILNILGIISGVLRL